MLNKMALSNIAPSVTLTLQDFSSAEMALVTCLWSICPYNGQSLRAEIYPPIFSLQYPQ